MLITKFIKLDNCLYSYFVCFLGLNRLYYRIDIIFRVQQIKIIMPRCDLLEVLESGAN